MDALILGTFSSPIHTVTTVWNTEETGDIYTYKEPMRQLKDNFKCGLQWEYENQPYIKC